LWPQANYLLDCPSLEDSGRLPTLQMRAVLFQSLIVGSTPPPVPVPEIMVVLMDGTVIKLPVALAFLLGGRHRDASWGCSSVASGIGNTLRYLLCYIAMRRSLEMLPYRLRLDAVLSPLSLKPSTTRFRKLTQPDSCRTLRGSSVSRISGKVSASASLTWMTPANPCA
jgi:hypothetical protein